ncbi:hypothetical protein I7I48_08863 [Histoplasma ohiense]|nr:hypothetical protein I7I48_08863 [Histoplasma ohiense (nom. inval.)]
MTFKSPVRPVCHQFWKAFSLPSPPCHLCLNAWQRSKYGFCYLFFSFLFFIQKRFISTCSYKKRVPKG